MNLSLKFKRLNIKKFLYKNYFLTITFPGVAQKTTPLKVTDPVLINGFFAIKSFLRR